MMKKYQGKSEKKMGEADTEAMFWQCDVEGLKLADQNEREIKEQARLMEEGEERKKRDDKRKAEAEKMKEKIERDNKALEEADEKGGLTKRAEGREETKKKYLQNKTSPGANTSSNSQALSMDTIKNVGKLSEMFNRK